MDRKTARRFVNLTLIAVFVIVVIIGFMLQFDAIESRTQQPAPEVPATVEEPEPDRILPPITEEPAREPAFSAGDNLAAALLKTVFYVVLIVAVIILGARVIRRYGGDRVKQTSSPEIRILGRRYISPKQSVVIVKVRQKELLLGITDHSIHLLYDFTPEE